MVGVWSDTADRCDVDAKLVRHDHARLAKLPDQPEEEALCSLRVATPLNLDVENITIGINGATESEFPAANRDDGLIHMPLIIKFWAIPADAIRKMAAKAVDPKANNFPADDDTA